MGEAAVELKVAGKTYQVVTSAAEDELRRLAQIVEQALEGVIPPGRQPSPQALVLAAITLAHELEAERERRIAAEERHKKVLRSLLQRVDQVLERTVPSLAKRGGKQTDSRSREPDPV
jgi:cell division protein ZapA